MKNEELSVDVIPEGKEDEYYTEEQSVKLKTFIDDCIKHSWLMFVCLGVFLLSTVFRIFDYFGLGWLQIVIGIIGLIVALVTLVVAIIFFVKCIKLKNILKDDK